MRLAARLQPVASAPIWTHLMSLSKIASGAAENTTKNLHTWIQNPDAIKPGSLMQP